VVQQVALEMGVTRRDDHAGDEQARREQQPHHEFAT
jgi:hypothetical protein